MTSPRHAADTENGRYYTHPVTGERLISVTNALSVGVAKYGLPPWYGRMTAERAMDNLPFLTKWSRTRRDDMVDWLKQAGNDARDQAADLGTRIHALADAHVTGAARGDDPEAAPYVEQYMRFLADFDVDIPDNVEFAELTVANPDLGYAGTADIGLHLALSAPGPDMSVSRTSDRYLWLIDIKTSATRASTQVFDSNALQLTGLRNATEMWLPDDTTTPMSPVAGCAVLNLRANTYAFIPVPAGPAEWAAFQATVTTGTWRHNHWAGDYAYRPISPDGVIKPKRQTTRKVA